MSASNKISNVMMHILMIVKMSTKWKLNCQCYTMNIEDGCMLNS